MDNKTSNEVELQKVQQVSKFQVIRRWTDAEITRLLKSILNYLNTEHDALFEFPTAKQFYEKIRKNYFTEGDFNIIALKSKMRHLRILYMKARDWELNVGSELYTSDQSYVQATKEKMCPFYNLLDQIFKSSLMKRNNSSVLHSNRPTAEFIRNPKKELSNETNFDNDFIGNEHSKNFHKLAKSQKSSTTRNLEEKKFELKRQKFKFNCKLEARRLNLENKKLKYEKEKFKREQEINEYELRKQNEIKIIEIETNQCLKLLENGIKIKNHDETMVNKEEESFENLEVLET